MNNCLTNGKEICAIAVTFHPDPEFPARISHILRQVGHLVIVDNGSNEEATRMLRGFAAASPVTLISNLSNRGIASALNTGINSAQRLGFKWVLLLDQDSCADEGMVETLIAVQSAFPDPDRLAVLGSGFRVAGAAPHGPLDGWEEAESVITSGSLVPLGAHAAVGPFREEFFIDYVDTEYCFRARAAGFNVIRTRKPIMVHSIGAISRHQLLWVKKWTFNHSADRRYYIARNDTVLLREYGHYRMGLWALKSFGRCVRLCKRIVLYEQMKTRKVIAVAQGWWHGIRGRMGPRL